jgi:hypothetical protein
MAFEVHKILSWSFCPYPTYNFNSNVTDVIDEKNTDKNRFFSNENIDISPNPANDILTIDFNFPGSSILNIYDILGNQIFSQNILNGQNRIIINTGELNSGLYILQISGSDKIFFKNFMILH